MVYVDDFYITGMGLGNMKMSHMVADTSEELLKMAAKIGMHKNWIQYPNTSEEHFDVSMSKRKLAISYGAKPVPMRELASAVTKRNGPNDKLNLYV